MHPKFSWSRNGVGSPKSTSSLRIFQVGSMFSVLPDSSISSTYANRKSPLARLTNKHSQFINFFPTVSQLNFLKLPFPQQPCQLGCQVLYHHGTSMIVPRFTFFTENFVIRCDQVTKMFRSGHDCTSTSSARSPVIFVFKQLSEFGSFGKCVYTLLLIRNQFHFCSRLHW